MDAKSVRNMYNIIAVTNKHTAKLHHGGSLYILSEIYILKTLVCGKNCRKYRLQPLNGVDKFVITPSILYLQHAVTVTTIVLKRAAVPLADPRRGLQPQSPPSPKKKRNIKNTNLVRTVISQVLCELRFNLNQSPKSADGWYIGILRNVMKTYKYRIISLTNFNVQFSLFVNVRLLHYYPRHVSSINMPISRRKNCIHTTSGIFALCKRLHNTLVESGLQSALNQCTVQTFMESEDAA